MEAVVSHQVEVVQTLQYVKQANEVLLLQTIKVLATVLETKMVVPLRGRLLIETVKLKQDGHGI